MPSWLRLPAALTVTVLLWGSAFVGIRAALPALGYANVASGRLLLAALTFAVLSRRFPVSRPARRQLPLLAALGATGYAGYQLLLSAAEETVPAGTSALLFSAAPVLASALAGPLLGDRLSRRGRIGLAVAVAGVAISEGGLSGPLTGGALVLGAVCVYALWIVLQKRALHEMSAFAVTAWATWLGAAIALPFSSGLPQAALTAPAGALITLVLLGTIVTTVPFLLWTWALSRLDTTAAAPFLLLIAPATLLIAWIWLNETPTALALTGGAVTLTGVAVAQLHPAAAWARLAARKPTLRASTHGSSARVGGCEQPAVNTGAVIDGHAPASLRALRSAEPAVQRSAGLIRSDADRAFA